MDVFGGNIVVHNRYIYNTCICRIVVLDVLWLQISNSTWNVSAMYDVSLDQYNLPVQFAIQDLVSMDYIAGNSPLDHILFSYLRMPIMCMMCMQVQRQCLLILVISLMLQFRFVGIPKLVWFLAIQKFRHPTTDSIIFFFLFLRTSDCFHIYGLSSTYIGIYGASCISVAASWWQ